MSVRPDNTTYMAPAIRNGESFHTFYECWLVEQNQYLQQLVSASKTYQDSSSTSIESTQESQERVLRPLIDTVVQHYEHYYQAKSSSAKLDVLAMFTPSWRSTLEDAFLWIGGWRPSMAFHLLYSKSGLQLETQLAELIQGLSTGDLSDLSPSQLIQVDVLQRKTIREEKDTTEKMAKHQETVADPSMVDLTHVVSELVRSGEAGQEEGGIEDQVESTIAPKESGLEMILQRADDLRLRTLKERDARNHGDDRGPIQRHGSITT
ncbi:hypothetical protein F0562_003475 [Nyssa sinensis]|uniref:DOG1 domain-containing protein n=1 Tax=Nyssa sinensis TaxID=561372 RepID=A0A5J5BWL7_9ASTE|nr:hypothetical protein F0562_003475 [Nyssa sinensis]